MATIMTANSAPATGYSGKIRAQGRTRGLDDYGKDATIVGKLHAIAKAEQDGYWLMECRHPKCNSKGSTRNTVTLSEDVLLSGIMSTCGCHPTKNEDFQEYEAWKKRRARCNNPKHPQYADYGGRGITHAPEWEDFKTFFRDMGPRPSKLHQCDRKDNDGRYGPDNCRWSLPIENSAPGARRPRKPNKVSRAWTPVSTPPQPPPIRTELLTRRVDPLTGRLPPRRWFVPTALTEDDFYDREAYLVGLHDRDDSDDDDIDDIVIEPVGCDPEDIEPD